MGDARETKLKKLIFIFYCLIEACFLLLGILFFIKGQYYRLLGCLMWGTILTYLFLIQPYSKWHRVPMAWNDPRALKKQNLITVLVLFLLILACTLPMGLAPAYNGEFPQHRNQYELLARSMKEGHVYLDYDDVDPILETIYPYDPAQRAAAGAFYHSDNAYYKGKYYMYFGVVPVILLFLPYLLLTGHDLTTYHGTQVFAAFAILGIFLLFRLLAKKYFRSMSFLLFITLSTVFSFICIYFSIGTPALYCTATTSAACMSIWSAYFFIRAIYSTLPENRWRRVLLACLGSLFGAMAFGCRPSAALGAFLLLIPFCVEYVRTELEFSKPKNESVLKLIGRVFLIGLPYVVIGILLMYYNYVRFENFFEFGQAYQLTIADQSQYGSFFEMFSTVRTVNGLLYNFIGFTPIIGEFPFVYYNSVFVNFPILLTVFLVFREKNRLKAKQCHFRLLEAFLFLAPMIVTVIQISWAPGNGSAERYRMDIYYLITLLAFLAIGFFMENAEKEKREKYGFLLCLFCLEAMMMAILFLLFPDDFNYTHWYPETLPKLRQIFLFR